MSARWYVTCRTRGSVQDDRGEPTSPCNSVRSRALLAALVPLAAPLAAAPPCNPCAGVRVEDPFALLPALAAAPHLDAEARLYVAWDVALDATATPAAAHALAGAAATPWQRLVFRAAGPTRRESRGAPARAGGRGQSRRDQDPARPLPDRLAPRRRCGDDAVPSGVRLSGQARRGGGDRRRPRRASPRRPAAARAGVADRLLRRGRRGLPGRPDPGAAARPGPRRRRGSPGGARPRQAGRPRRRSLARARAAGARRSGARRRRRTGRHALLGAGARRRRARSARAARQRIPRRAVARPRHRAHGRRRVLELRPRRGPRPARDRGGAGRHRPTGAALPRSPVALAGARARERRGRAARRQPPHRRRARGAPRRSGAGRDPARRARLDPGARGRRRGGHRRRRAADAGRGDPAPAAGVRGRPGPAAAPLPGAQLDDAALPGRVGRAGDRGDLRRRGLRAPGPALRLGVAALPDQRRGLARQVDPRDPAHPAREGGGDAARDPVRQGVPLRARAAPRPSTAATAGWSTSSPRRRSRRGAPSTRARVWVDRADLRARPHARGAARSRRRGAVERGDHGLLAGRRQRPAGALERRQLLPAAAHHRPADPLGRQRRHRGRERGGADAGGDQRPRVRPAPRGGARLRGDHGARHRRGAALPGQVRRGRRRTHGQGGLRLEQAVRPGRRLLRRLARLPAAARRRQLLRPRVRRRQAPAQRLLRRRARHRQLRRSPLPRQQGGPRRRRLRLRDQDLAISSTATRSSSPARRCASCRRG